MSGFNLFIFGFGCSGVGFVAGLYIGLFCVRQAKDEKERS